MRSLFSLSLLITLSSIACATDWLTYPSTYTHSPVNGERVAQYAEIPAPTAPMPANFRSSGYTHTRSSVFYGGSADHYHRVDQWGEPVRPYGEWQFPFRPYSTPYFNWGPPYAGLNLGFGFPGYGYPGYPNQGGNPSGHPYQGGYPHGGYHQGGPPQGSYPRGGWGYPRYPNERGYLGDGTWPIERQRPFDNPPPATAW